MNRKLTVIFLISSIWIIGMMGFADASFIDEDIFDVTINGDEFTITFDENPSTGYTWKGFIDDKSNNVIEFISQSSLVLPQGLIGRGGSRSFTYKVKKDGIGLMYFTNSGCWDSGNEKVVDILVSMKKGKLLVKKNNVSYDPVIALKEEFKLDNMIIIKNGQMIESEVSIQEINDITMIPLSAVLEAAGFTLKWNKENKSIDILRGVQFTTIYIGENSYFKNKISPSKLSAAPIIVNNRTLVPAEFFTKILNINVSISKGRFTLLDSEVVTNSGYVNEIRKDSDGNISITISKDKDSKDRNTFTVINTLKDITIFNKKFEVGDYINVICSLMSTKSIPPQTPGYIIY